jgi:hypothetical protein
MTTPGESPAAGVCCRFDCFVAKVWSGVTSQKGANVELDF